MKTPIGERLANLETQNQAQQKEIDELKRSLKAALEIIKHVTPNNDAWELGPIIEDL